VASTEATLGVFTVTCESIHPPLAFFLFYCLTTWNKKIFLGGVVSIDLHNMPTTLKMQNIFVNTQKKTIKGT
jgi:hypothetical protein